MRQMLTLNNIKHGLIFFLIFMLFPIFAGAIPEQTTEFYVNDFADVLSEETEEYIIKQSNALYHADGSQIVVVTIDTLDGAIIENYATEMFRTYGIGDDEKNNGLLILIVVQDREFRVETGYGMEGTLPDLRINQITQDFLIPYLSEDKWDDGIKTTYDAMFERIVIEHDLDIDYDVPIGNNEGSEVEDVNIWLLVMTVLGVAVFAGMAGKEASVKQRVLYENQTRIEDPALRSLIKKDKKIINHQDVVVDKNKVVLLLIIALIIFLIGQAFVGSLASFINFFVGYIAYTVQFPNNNTNSTGSSSSGGFFGGGSSGGGFGGGSFGGGGSSGGGGVSGRF